MMKIRLTEILNWLLIERGKAVCTPHKKFLIRLEQLEVLTLLLNFLRDSVKPLSLKIYIFSIHTLIVSTPLTIDHVSSEENK